MALNPGLLTLLDLSLPSPFGRNRHLQTILQLKDVLRSRGLSVRGTNMRKADYISRIVKSETQLMVYEPFYQADLTEFVEKRGLQRVSKGDFISYKAALIDTLESADRNLKFPFLKLPAELRNIIYKLVLVATPTTTVTSRTQPPLTKVCKQVRNEALSIYYAYNQFLVTVSDKSLGANERFHNLSMESISKLRTLDFYWTINKRAFDKILTICFDFSNGSFAATSCYSRNWNGAIRKYKHTGFDVPPSSALNTLVKSELKTYASTGLTLESILRLATRFEAFKSPEELQQTILISE